MKRTIYIISIVAAILCATACKPEDTPTEAQKRTIIYAVNQDESQVALKNDAEWDALLERFCDYATEGKSVTFYGLASQFRSTSSAKNNSQGNQEVTTITTTSRDEIKAWMRKMEQAGKTVNVVYIRESGQWKGTAYAHAPTTTDEVPFYSGVLTQVSMPNIGGMTLPGMMLALHINNDSTLIIIRNNMVLDSAEELGDYSIGDSVTLHGTVYTIEDDNGMPIMMLDITLNDEASIEGTWIYSTLMEYVVGNGNNYMVDFTTLFFDEDETNLVYFTFLNGGSATRTIGSPTAQPITGSWSLSGDGILSCDLFDVEGSRWNINWLTNNSMIISSAWEGDTVYLISLRKF